MIVRPGFKIEKNDCDFLVFVGVGLINPNELWQAFIEGVVA